MSTPQQLSALKFITCGSVDDGKSTLIGRLLVDTKSVLQDQLSGVQRSGATDLALLTDGLSAEREQGITIDVAYRYFNTEHRKFIISDAPGHEQYTRNMVTAASSADAAVVLVDATKLDWASSDLDLLAQTRRHTLLVDLLRVPSIVFAVNKLDAVEDATVAFQNICEALGKFAKEAGITPVAIVPVSALKGWNVVSDHDSDWCHYSGPSLLKILETLPVTPADNDLALSFPVQMVERPDPNVTSSRRVFWGRVSTGNVKVGDTVQVFPSGQTATVSAVLSATRQHLEQSTGGSTGLVLERELDISRGDWICSEEANAFTKSQVLTATVAWLDDEPLVVGRIYWALHGHRWVKVKVQLIHHRLNVTTLEKEETTQLAANSIGCVVLAFREPVMTTPYSKSRVLGSMVLVDPTSHKTSGAVLVGENA